MDLQRDREESRLHSVGTHAHGLVLWRDMLLVLDSEDSALVAVHPGSGRREVVWRVSLKIYLGQLIPEVVRSNRCIGHESAALPEQLYATELDIFRAVMRVQIL